MFNREVPRLMNSETILLKMPAKFTGESVSASGKVLTVLAMLLVSGLFFLSDDHRYGLLLLREGVIGLSLLALLYVLMSERYVLDKADWYLIIMAGLLFMVPPIFAYLHFHQPVYFGLLEERRTLLYLVYFLLLAVVASNNRRFSEQDIESVLRYLFWIALAWSAANAFELIPRNSGFSFSVRDEQFAEDFVAHDERFATRFIDGGFLIALYPYYLLARGAFVKSLLPVILLIVYMILINQTRGLALAMFLSACWILVLRKRDERLNISVLMLVPTVFLLGYFAYFLYVQAFDSQVFFYDYHRNRELSVVMDDILRNFFLPHGSLSLQFNEGFFAIYGIQVYLSDIGFVGLLFKYGILFIPLVVLLIMIVRLLYGKYRNDFSIILMAVLLADFMVSPFGDLLGRSTEEFAILMVLTRLQGVFHGHQYIARVRRGRAS